MHKSITIHDKEGTRIIPYTDQSIQGSFEVQRRLLALAHEEHTPTVVIESALCAQPGTNEKTNPHQRATALAMRLMPLSGMWLILSFTVVFVFSWSWPIAFLLFALLTAITYIVMDRQEYQFSKNGVERYRIQAARDLKMAELAYHAQLRKMALESYLRVLERYDE